MRFSRLDDWLAWQETLHPKAWDLGLERVGAVAEALGVTRLPSTVITVAGTNGKGSTVAFLEAIYRTAGFSTGAYTSPHLHRYNERLRLDGEAVADAEWVAAFDRVDCARGETSLTYFEFGTLAALDLLGRAAPDVVLLEVGLGGRLDAVNATTPDATVITTVDLDHQAWLGDDRETIGAEKAGIFRPGCPAIVAEVEPPESVVAAAHAVGAPLWRLGERYRLADGAQHWDWLGPPEGPSWQGLPPPALPGEGQRRNAAAALAVVAALMEQRPVAIEAIHRGLQDVRVPGRFEIRPGAPTLILDVGHNGQAIRALAGNLAEHPCGGRTHAVVAMLGDKVAETALIPLLGAVDVWYPAALNGFRGRSASCMTLALADAAGPGLELGHDPAEEPGPAAALAAALEAAEPEDRVLVFGSFQTVAGALAEGHHDPAA